MSVQNVFKYLEALTLSALAVFAPIQASLLALLVLIFADLVTGLMAAKKQGIPITSSGLRRTISKIFVYETAILMGYLAEHFLLSDFIPITKLITGTITLVELKSLFENLDLISGSQLLKSIIDKLGSKNDRI